MISCLFCLSQLLGLTSPPPAAEPLEPPPLASSRSLDRVLTDAAEPLERTGERFTSSGQMAGRSGALLGAPIPGQRFTEKIDRHVVCQHSVGVTSCEGIRQVSLTACEGNFSMLTGRAVLPCLHPFSSHTRKCTVYIGTRTAIHTRTIAGRKKSVKKYSLNCPAVSGSSAALYGWRRDATSKAAKNLHEAGGTREI